LVQFAVIAIFSWKGLAGVLVTLAGILLFQAVIFMIFGFETKGRALEEASGTATEVVDAASSRKVVGIGA
jgi:MFS transporter, putative metabolite:H+ symporter